MIVEWWVDSTTDERVVSVAGKVHRISAMQAMERGRRAFPISAPTMNWEEVYELGLKSWLREIFAPDDPPVWIMEAGAKRQLHAQ